MYSLLVQLAPMKVCYSMWQVEGFILCKSLSVFWGFFQLLFFCFLCYLCWFFALSEIRDLHYFYSNSTTLLQKLKQAVVYETCLKFFWFSIFYTALSFCDFPKFFFLNKIILKKLRNHLESYFSHIFTNRKVEKRSQSTNKNNHHANVIKLMIVTSNSK